MAAIYLYSEARQKLASLLRQASEEGEVRIKRKDGQVFILRPEEKKKSPLDIKGVKTSVSKEDILQAIRDSRKRGR